MNVEFVRVTENPELLIENTMRICHGGCVTNGEPNRNFIKSIIKLGHESPLEHASVTMRIGGVSRALTHQLVRHRLASYTQRSQRYCKEIDFDYVTPESIEDRPELCEKYDDLMLQIGELYKLFVNAGIKREDARYMLPNACETEIYVTMNFRELRHFIYLRSDIHAQWEIRHLADMILWEMYKIAPSVFEDLFVKYFPNGTDTEKYDKDGNLVEKIHNGPTKTE